MLCCSFVFIVFFFLFLYLFLFFFFFFFFNDTATTEIYTLSLHDALPISAAILASEAELARRETLARLQDNRPSQPAARTVDRSRRQTHLTRIQQIGRAHV